MLRGVFHHHHGIGPGRQHGAGGHPQGLALAHAEGGGHAHGHFPFDFQVLGRADAGPEGILGPDCVAVHGGPQKPRHLLRRVDGRGQDPAAGCGQIHLLHPHRAKPVIKGQDFLAGLQAEEF